MQRRDLRSKSRKGRDGREIGNRPFGRGQLHYLLTNPVYRGRTRHGGTDHEGRHPAIIDDDQWQRVQQMLQQKAGRGRGDPNAETEAASLTGKLIDETGDRLTPTHTTKGSQRYRYYVSNRMISGPPDPQGWRLPAPTLELQIAGALRGHLARALDGHHLLATPDLSRHEQLRSKLEDLVAPDAPNDIGRQRKLLDLVEQGTIGRETTTLQFDPHRLAAILGVSAAEIASVLTVTAPISIRRRGVEARLVIGERPRQPDAKLVAALARAHRWLQAIRSGRDIASLAKADGIAEGTLRVHLQLALLAPAIQQVILDGTQPEGLTLHRLTRPKMPADWHAQCRRIGINPA